MIMIIRIPCIIMIYLLGKVTIIIIIIIIIMI